MHRTAPALILLALLLVNGVGAAIRAVRMPGTSHTGPLPALTSQEAARVGRLTTTIDTLAVTIGERNVHHAPENLARAEAFLRGELESLGFEVRREAWVEDGVEVANLIAERPGNREIVLVGAHYDSAHGTPGADDNASGVAALLALAAEVEPGPRTLRFVAFANEEPPFFHEADMGSRVHARGCAERGEDIVAMLSLETLAYYKDEPGTQVYPPVVSSLYPNTGNFVGFVADRSSLALVHRVTHSFREHAAFPSQGASLPASVEGVGWSDHRSFWEQGYPAVMVTDTAPNRNPHYHEPTDLPETLDVERLSRVVTGLVGVIEDLTGATPG
ncbi:MAG: M28 family peptidase [Deltaproteobacteria bacterium]|nr:MAG: M28 family peptidase [Deltaproteobacteria bacterium]